MESCSSGGIGAELMEWSIVIPVHNEAANLEAYATQFIEELPAT